MGKKEKNLNHLEKIALQDGEHVEHAVLGAYETKLLGADTVMNGILAATNQRLVFFNKRLTGYDLESFDYDKISSIAMSKKMMGHVVTFYASGNKVEVKWIQDPDIDNFITYVKERMTKKETAQPVASNKFEEIKQLKELLDMGAITQEEFDNKKVELL